MITKLVKGRSFRPQ